MESRLREFCRIGRQTLSKGSTIFIPASAPDRTIIFLFTNIAAHFRIVVSVSCPKFGIIPLGVIDSSDRAGTYYFIKLGGKSI